jgi:hypothetical protein
MVVTVLSLQLEPTSSQDLRVGAAIAPSKLLYQGSTYSQQESVPSFERRIQKRAAKAACAYGRRASKEPVKMWEKAT